MPEVLKRVAYAGAVLHCLSWAINANYEAPDPLHTILVLAGAACLVLIVIRNPYDGAATLSYALIVGLAFHLTFNPQLTGSDVIAATDEALRTLMLGANPYTHHFVQTRFIGEPFPYFPGELAFYGLWKFLFGNIFFADKAAGILILLLLALAAPFVGREIAALATALYALSPMAVYRANEGANDTALALLIYVSVVLLALAVRSAFATRLARTELILSAVFCGWALAFKATAFVVLPFVWLYLARTNAPWRHYVTIALGTFLLFVIPFFIWNPAGFVQNLVGGISVHHDIYGLNLWNLIAALSPGAAQSLNPVIPYVEALVLAVCAVALARLPLRGLGTAVLAGCALMLVVLMFARWSSAAYYTFLFTIALLGTEFAIGDMFRSPERSD